MMEDRFSRVTLGRLALLAGLVGLVSFAALIAALSAPPPSPGTLRRASDPFRWQDAGVIVQALIMLPVTIGLGAIAEDSGISRPGSVRALGLFGQLALALSSVLIFTGTTADMLYMLPLGLVGLWVFLMSGRIAEQVGRATLWIGRIAGIGLMLVGAGFLIYGVFVAPHVFLGPLSDAEIDRQSWTAPNIVAHLCLAAGTLLGRLLYPVWLLLVGSKLTSRRCS